MKKLLIILILGFSLFVFHKADAAIGFDSAASSTGSGVSSLTFSHTSTGSNLILIVNFWLDEAFGDAGASVTYNSVSMTEAGHSGLGGIANQYIFYLVAPDTGAHNVVISLNAAKDIEAGSITYTGAKQTGQFDAIEEHSQAGPTTGTWTEDVTTVADNSWHIFSGLVGGTHVIGSGGSVKRSRQKRAWVGGSNQDENPA